MQRRGGDRGKTMTRMRIWHEKGTRPVEAGSQFFGPPELLCLQPFSVELEESLSLHIVSQASTTTKPSITWTKTPSVRLRYTQPQRKFSNGLVANRPSASTDPSSSFLHPGPLILNLSRLSPIPLGLPL